MSQQLAWRTVMTNGMSISAACAAAGCSVSALRSWERSGILNFEIRRDHWGRRLFADEDVERLRAFIRRRAAANAQVRQRSG